MLFLILGCTDYLIVDKDKDAPEFDSGPAVVDSVPEETAVDSGGETAESAETGVNESSPPDTVDTAPPDTSPPDTGDPPDTGEPPACRRILVYSTEGRSDRANYLGFFDSLPTEAALAGFEVVVEERAYDGRLDAAKLEGFSQVWIFGVDRDTTSAPVAGEILAVQDFVAAGGGLLLAAEHEDTVYSYVEDVNGFAEPFGVSFGGSHNEGADGGVRTVEGPTGPLAVGISTVPGFASTAYLELTDAAVQPAWSLDGSPTVAWREEGARVVFDRSWGGYRDLFIPIGDQATYLTNAATFLDPCE